MAKILMVTSRDVVDDNGNARGVGAATLIYRRSAELYKEFGAKTYIMPMNGNVKKITTGYVGSEFLPFNKSSIKEAILKFITENKPGMIILSGEKSYIFITPIKYLLDLYKIESEIVIDLHGALEEGIEYDKGFRWVKSYFRYRIKTLLFKRAAIKANGFFVVSDELKEHYKRIIPDKLKGKNFYKIRCGINEEINNDKRIEWRKEIRKLLGLNDDTIVFVYSGYRAKWQCLDEIIANFREFDYKKENVFFLLLTKTDKSFEKLLKDSFPKGNYFSGLVPHDEIHKYLSACDVGMLIRHNNYTNKVAFPNKFSDYINAGLMVILSPSLREPTRLLEDYKIPHIKLKPGEKVSESELSTIENRQMSLHMYYDLCNNLCNNELLYSSQLKKQYSEFDKAINNNHGLK